MVKQQYEKPETLVVFYTNTQFICVSTDGAGEHNPGNDNGGEGDLPPDYGVKKNDFGFDDYEGDADADFV